MDYVPTEDQKTPVTEGKQRCKNCHYYIMDPRWRVKGIGSRNRESHVCPSWGCPGFQYCQHNSQHMKEIKEKKEVKDPIKQNNFDNFVQDMREMIKEKKEKEKNELVDIQKSDNDDIYFDMTNGNGDSYGNVDGNVNGDSYGNGYVDGNGNVDGNENVDGNGNVDGNRNVDGNVNVKKFENIVHKMPLEDLFLFQKIIKTKIDKYEILFATMYTKETI